MNRILFYVELYCCRCLLVHSFIRLLTWDIFSTIQHFESTLRARSTFCSLFQFQYISYTNFFFILLYILNFCVECADCVSLYAYVYWNCCCRSCVFFVYIFTLQFLAIQSAYINSIAFPFTFSRFVSVERIQNRAPHNILVYIRFILYFVVFFLLLFHFFFCISFHFVSVSLFFNRSFRFC